MSLFVLTIDFWILRLFAANAIYYGPSKNIFSWKQNSKTISLLTFNFLGFANHLFNQSIFSFVWSYTDYYQTRNCRNYKGEGLGGASTLGAKGNRPEIKPEVVMSIKAIKNVCSISPIDGLVPTISWTV